MLQWQFEIFLSLNFILFLVLHKNKNFCGFEKKSFSAFPQAKVHSNKDSQKIIPSYKDDIAVNSGEKEIEREKVR